MLRRAFGRLQTLRHARLNPNRALQIRYASRDTDPPRSSPITEPGKASKQSTSSWPTARFLSKSPWRYLAIQWIKYGVAGYLLFHIFVEYFFSVDGAWGISMLPTIAAFGEHVVISKYYRRGREVKVGDLVSFKHPLHVGEHAVKRVLGMPGDFVMVGVVGEANRMLQIPEGHCWVAGDNMSWSRDSRLFGPLPLALITGKVIYAGSGLTWRRLDHDMKPATLEDGELD